MPLVSLAALLWPLSSDAPKQSAAQAAYQALPPQPAGDTERGRAGVERTAIALAAWLHAVPGCAADKLAVSWTEPSSTAGHGAYVTPLGPAPTDSTTSVNGIVVCSTSGANYMGFQARYVGSRWDVVSVPPTDDDTTPGVAEPATPPPANTPTLDGRTFGAAIEAPADYEPQRTCDPTAKVGTVALKNLLLKTYPSSRSLGIGTACDGSVSEHHEGRAFDWGVRVTVPSEKAMAQSFIDKVLAPDQYGNQFALARRMGIMYLIWDHHIWSTYRASEGWRAYTGTSPHTDHIHISMSWAGALGKTSFWSGNVAQELAAAVPPAAKSTQLAAAPAKKKATTAAKPRNTTTTAPRRRRDVTIDTQLTADQQAQWQAEWEARQAARRRRQQPPSTTTTSTTAPDASSTSTTSTTWPRRTHPTWPSTTTTVPRSTTTTVPRSTTTTVPRSTTTTVPHSTTTTVPPAVDQERQRADRHRRGSTPWPSTTTTTAPHATTTTAPSATTTTQGQ